jgi:tetratricopeptide (TPR) repeat protein
MPNKLEPRYNDENQNQTKRKALVVSVSEYVKEPQPLISSRYNGIKMKELLNSLGYQVTAIIGAVDSIEDTIIDFFNSKPIDTLLFYYSGRCIYNDQEVYLTSSESALDVPSFQEFSFDELMKIMCSSKSIRIFTVLDCKIGKGHEDAVTSIIDDRSKVLKQGEGKCLLFANQEDYAPTEQCHSILTHYLVEGLRGNEKSVDDKGNVTPSSLSNYIYRSIQSLAVERRLKLITRVEASDGIVLEHYPQLAKIKADIVEQDPNDLIAEALVSLERADYDSTIEYADKAIGINPRFAFAYNVKGQALFNLKLYQEALSCYEKALELKPQYTEAINNKGLVLAAIGDYTKAIECFNQSSNLNPRDPNIWNYKGLAFHALGKYEDAIASYDIAIRNTDNYSEALKNKELSLSQLDKALPLKMKKDSIGKVGIPRSSSTSEIPTATLTSQRHQIPPSQTSGTPIAMEEVKSSYSTKRTEHPSGYSSPKQNTTEVNELQKSSRWSGTFSRLFRKVKEVKEEHYPSDIDIDIAAPLPTSQPQQYPTSSGTTIASTPSYKTGGESIYQNKITRYPYVRFPSKVALEDIIPLQVIIKAVQLPSHYKSTSITLSANAYETEIPVQVIVDTGSGFEVVGERYYATIYAPVGPEDSKPVIFNLKAKADGVQTVVIRFFQQETYVGEIKIDVLVTYSKAPVMVGEPKESTLNRLPENVLQGPDITIFIHEKKISPEFEYDVLIYSYDIPMKRMGPLRFPINPEKKFQMIFEDIENMNLRANILDRKIKAKGMALYDELFPESLKNLYWEKRDRINSIRVISKEPWIPWEIIRPWHKLDNGEIKEDEFLCERYAFARWIVDKPDTIKENLKKVKMIVPSDTNLSSALKERDWIEQFGKTNGLEVSFDSTYDQVITTFETGGLDLLHFSTHGEHNKESPLLSAIELEDKVQLRAEDIGGAAMKFGNSSPFVILNACQTGNQGFSITGVQGWATRFLSAGASVFIGTLWSVSDEVAFRFVQGLYSELSIGTTLGEAVRKARNKCKQSGDPSWLAYQLYGHPNVKISFGYASAIQNT